MRIPAVHAVDRRVRVGELERLEGVPTVTTSSFMCVCGVELGERRPMRMPVVAHMLVEPIIVVWGRVGEVPLWCEMGPWRALGRCSAGSRLKGGWWTLAGARGHSGWRGESGTVSGGRRVRAALRAPF
jgi:hypothetical protein